MRWFGYILSFFFIAGAVGQSELLVSDTVADDATFIARLNVDALKPVTIQHNQTLKTLDSFARQTLTTITGRKSYQGQPAVYTVLDMTFRPEIYRDVNIIKIRNAVLRQDLMQLKSLSDEERTRIGKEGTISLRFWFSDEVQHLMSDLQSQAVFKAQAIGQVQEAAQTLISLSAPDLHAYHIFPPATAEKHDHVWRCLPDLYGTVPAWAEVLRSNGGSPPPPLPGYEKVYEPIEKSGAALLLLADAWRARDADKANTCVDALVKHITIINPAVYPSLAKRRVEVVYNRLAQLMIPGIMLYFTALLLFSLGARSGVPGLRVWGLRVIVLAFLVHTAGIGIRWWLVEKSVGNWFEAIPIKNQFESVMFSIWFATLIALLLEFRNRRGLYGAAAAFVGTASMVALLTVPYFYRDIGGEIGQVQGVLMSYWLYIHVTMVVAAYGLIGMMFLLSVWWLWGYYREYGTLSRISNQNRLSADAVRGQDVLVTPGGEVVAPTFARSLVELLFLARPAATATATTAAAPRVGEEEAPQFQARLDACNLVVLHMIFWILGLGIILGAVWADMSWGRPWGWDPKETFALVTWIVYLVIVHVRVITSDKAFWTAVLGVIGFFIMLFNWIGVNFFLAGLHSYAG